MDEPSDAPAARLKPTQARSRLRMDLILGVAAQLIAERGSDQVRMSEVADLAGISIGSLYQYFPDKAAIVRTLAQRYQAQSRACIEEALAPVATAGQLRDAFSGLVDLYYATFLAEPVMRDVWIGMQADKQLMALELAESRAAAELLAAAIRLIRPESDGDVFATALCIWQLGEAAMRLAISLDRAEGDAVVEAYKRMSLRELP